jgi:hypothetical protein
MPRVLVVALALTACACARITPYTRTPRDCQADAVAMVWGGVFHRTDQAPDIWWVPPADQTCGRVINGARGFPSSVMDADGTMVPGCAGSAAAGKVAVELVWYGAWQLTGLAHEYVHIIQARDGLPPDFAHQTPDFAPGGRVALANARLAAAQLCAQEKRDPP